MGSKNNGFRVCGGHFSVFDVREHFFSHFARTAVEWERIAPFTGDLCEMSNPVAHAQMD